MAVVALLCAGCMVGPDYFRPSVPVTPAYKEDQGWKLAQPRDQIPRSKWWEIFGDPQLNALEEQVDQANQNVKVAEARYRQARALIGFFRAGLFPTVTAGASANSVRNSTVRPFGSPSSGASGGTSGGTSTGTSSSGASSGEFLLTGDISYEIDLWGRIRRSVTAAREEAQASAADLETARLSLQAELAFDYFELRSADAQQRLLNDTVQAFKEALQLTINRFEGGAAPKSDVAQAQTQLETTQVQATDIAVQRAQFEHAIATLVGKPPADFSLPPAPLELQPPDIPAGLPSELLERRPDIAAAERRVAEANEQIGIAKAAYFPTVTLNALLGFESSSIRNLGGWQSFLWAVGSSLAQTVFDGGRRRATSKAALANYDATVASYRQATLDAFQQVEDNLAALRILEQEAEQQQRAVASARESLQLFSNRYKGGVDTYLQVITAQTVTLANERNQVDILRRRMDASVLLVKAVGGGWNVTDLPNL
ncbi:MAG: efflux transporter outer membrane subunit [Deltaproteobacteria bacterium]|nr:MAG: efflux transporter outer membrane subunit [Deltaproteobacteria bacterium]